MAPDLSAALGRGLRSLAIDAAVLVLPAVVAIGVATSVVEARPDRFEATAAFTLRGDGADDQVVGASSVNAATEAEQISQVMSTFERPEVLSETSRRLGGRLSPGRLRDVLTVAPYGINGAVGVTARTGDPRLSALAANVAVDAESVLKAKSERRANSLAADAAEARLAIARRSGADRAVVQLQRRLAVTYRARAALTYPIERLTTAQVPTDPAGTSSGTIGLLAGGLGLVGGFALLVFRLRGPGARRVVVGSLVDDEHVGTMPDRLLGRIVRADDPAIAEEDLDRVRLLRTNTDLLRPGGVRIVTVAGATSGTGASGVAASLAFSFAELGRRVLLVELDLRAAEAEGRLGLPTGAGLGEVLTGRESVDDVVRSVLDPGDAQLHGFAPGGGVDLVGAGTAGPDAVDAFDAGVVRRLIDRLRPDYDVVVLDAAPLLMTSEGLVAASASDAVLVCLRSGLTTGAQGRDVGRLLRRLARRPAVGHVVTGDRLVNDLVRPVRLAVAAGATRES